MVSEGAELQLAELFVHSVEEDVFQKFGQVFSLDLLFVGLYLGLSLKLWDLLGL